MATEKASSDYLKRHGRNERAMAKVLRRFFRAQNKRIMAALGPHLLPAQLKLNFHRATEADAMLAEIEPLILAIMATEAAGVLKQAGTLRTTKGIFDFGKFKLPRAVVSAIESTFEA